MNLKALLVCLPLLLGPTLTFAKPDVDPSSEGSLKLRLPTTNSQMSSSLLPSIEPQRFGDFTILAGTKVLNTSARLAEFRDDSGRRYRLKSEYFLGASHHSGWGLSVTTVTNGVSFGRRELDAYGGGDPSLTLAHPNFYKDSALQLSGQLRRYFAVTDRSKDRTKQQYSYYLSLNANLASTWAFFNTLIPRYFAQSYFKPSDTSYYIEDYAALTKQFTSWLKLGIGQHSQIEWHSETSTGTSLDVYPFLTFIFSRNFSIEPRFVFPLQKTNEVYDTASSVSLAQAQLEVTAQASF